MPNTDYGKAIVESLKLQTTLSNPKLALTVFMPEDKVRPRRARCKGGEDTEGRECEAVWPARAAALPPNATPARSWAGAARRPGSGARAAAAWRGGGAHPGRALALSWR